MSTQFFELAQNEQIASLSQTAREALKLYGLNTAQVECINYEFNATFKVTTDSGHTYALRININSTRSTENTQAEVEWVQSLSRNVNVNVPAPIANLSDSFVTSISHVEIGRSLNCVLYTWLEGEEIGDEPSLDQLHRIGQTLAHLHIQGAQFQLSSKAELPTFNDLLWGTEDYLFSEKSELSASDRKLLQESADEIMKFTHVLYEQTTPQIIHADLHGWNMMGHDDLIYIIDFDDCGFGLPAQDMAITLYYLDTPEQEAALFAGYESVKLLPEFSPTAMKALLLQRRLMLLNYLFETNNLEHKQMLPKYLEQSRERVLAFLTDVRG